MKSLISFILLLLLPVLSAADGYEINKYNCSSRVNVNFLWLSHSSDAGSTFQEILSVISIHKKTIEIRLTGSLPTATKDELMEFYSKRMPNELESALASSGNLHNPTLKPLIYKFKEAFKTTSMYSEISQALGARGYSIREIDIEKFTIGVGTYGISIPDITLVYKESA